MFAMLMSTAFIPARQLDSSHFIPRQYFLVLIVTFARSEAHLIFSCHLVDEYLMTCFVNLRFRSGEVAQ